MMYVVVICAVFLAAGLAMISKLGQGNSAALQAAAASARAARRSEFNVEGRDFYLQQFDEAVSSRH